MRQSWWNKRNLTRFMIVVPPILFILYSVHSLGVIRGLLADSTKFHISFANDLIQEYLAMGIALDLSQLKHDPDMNGLDWVSTVGEGEPLTMVDTHHDGQRPVYLKHQDIGEVLSDYFHSKAGPSAMFSERRFHEPVYWFRILAPGGREVYSSGPMPTNIFSAQVFDMDKSLVGYEVEVVYNSFGAKQLYSVSRSKINFGLIFFLFLMAILSIFLFTRSIRQKILLAKQKSFFVSTVSHEFKTPLAIMKVAAETLEGKRYKTEEEEKRFLGMMNNEINRLNHLVQKILEYNKIEMGQMQFQTQDIDMRRILEPSLTVFQTKAQMEKVDLITEICDDDCPVKGDAGLLRHAIDNIIDNAFKYRGKSDRIEVSCDCDDRIVTLKVRDYGVGIPVDELPNISKSFYRVDDDKTRGIRGSGLGLAITTYILKHAGGSLDIESAVGEGSTFTIILPVARS